MKIYQNLNDQKLIAQIKTGKIGVIPTDTIYGLVGSAFDRSAVERIYRVRKRNLKKPMIILIGKISDLKLFGINVKAETAKILKKFWPGPVSIILPCQNRKFDYLHRGTKSLAFRLPAKTDLVKLLQKTGPLVAPSANIEGEMSAENIPEAQKYFGDNIDFYVDQGELIGKPSELIKIENNKIVILR